MTLKEARKAKGYTQSDLGILLGVTQRTISHYESNIRKPSLDHAKDIADALDIELIDVWRMFSDKRSA